LIPRRTSSIAASALALAAFLLPAKPVGAYSVASGVSEACHEQLTSRAGVDILLDIPPPGSVQVPSGNWKDISAYLLEPLGLDLGAMDDSTRFLLTSLVVGAREPDTDGHSVMNIENLHQLHGDPSALGQYSHALRGPDDDFQAGDAAAVAGTRALILELVDEAQSYLERPPSEQLVKTEVYLDFYGQVDVEVYAPLFHAGRAAHALQDSFSHAIRSDQDQLRQVVHVMNYIDAITTDFKEKRDGLAHSNSFDKCNDSAIKPLSDAAVAATADLFAAVRDQFHGLDPGATEAVLDEWLTLKPGCTFENDFCDNGHWIEVARRDQTGPYVRGLFGCATGRPVGSCDAVPVHLLVLALLAATVLLRRWR
jgi:hypothetical protein